MHMGVDQPGQHVVPGRVHDNISVETRAEFNDEAVLKRHVRRLEPSRMRIKDGAAGENGPHRPTPSSNIVTIASMTSELRPLGSSESMSDLAADMMRS